MQVGHGTQSGPISSLSHTFGFGKGRSGEDLVHWSLHMAELEPEEWTQLLRAATASEE